MKADEIGGWFPDENRQTLEYLIDKYPIRSVLEIGSFLGLSAAWFAQRVEHVTCVDLWIENATARSNNNLVETLQQCGLPRDFFDIFCRNMKAVGVMDKITAIRGNSRFVADLVPAHDLVYIDADHSLEGCTSDLTLYGPKARFVLCGDDFVDRPEFGVIPAVRQYIPAPHLRTYVPFWWAENDLPIPYPSSDPSDQS
jgi:hypothetical protein